jgi:hypothetical protein
MLSATWSLTKSPRLIRRSYSTFNEGTLPAVHTIIGSFDTVNINEFRDRAFIPEKPVLITTRGGLRSISADTGESHSSLPAVYKWFSKPVCHGTKSTTPSQALDLSHQYLSTYGSTILPYELIIDSKDGYVRDWIQNHGAGDGNQGLATLLSQLLEISDGESFHRFNAPLSFFLQACRSSSPSLRRLYIAQAQITDLPKELQDDLPTPRLVKEAGRGDVYDANIWMGVPPTYTPLHKDPNPNLFMQLASSKRVRLFPPNRGSIIFQDVQQRIGQYSSASFRGDEMMEGPERDALDQAVWGDSVPKEGLEATVNPGDALFIPKGWWHSIKSVGTDVTVSVNWWFR